MSAFWIKQLYVFSWLETIAYPASLVDPDPTHKNSYVSVSCTVVSRPLLNVQFQVCKSTSTWVQCTTCNAGPRSTWLTPLRLLAVQVTLTILTKLADFQGTSTWVQCTTCNAGLTPAFEQNSIERIEQLLLLPIYRTTQWYAMRNWLTDCFAILLRVHWALWALLLCIICYINVLYYMLYKCIICWYKCIICYINVYYAI